MPARRILQNVTRSCCRGLALLLAGAVSVRSEDLAALRNGGMEAGADGEAPPGWELLWNPQTRDIRRDVDPMPITAVPGGRTGVRAARLIKAPDLEFVYAQQYVPVQIEPESRYVFRVWLRSDTPVSGVGLHLYLTPRGQREGGPYRARSSVDVGTEWASYEIDLDLGVAQDLNHDQGYHLRPIVQLHTAAVALDMDDARLERVATRVSAAELADMAAMRAHLATLPATTDAPIGITGGIVNGPDGSLLAFGSDFTVRESRDGGETWGAARKLAVSDPFDKITGAIAMSDGTLGMWTESWGKPMFFWTSTDGGRTWSERIEIGPRGAPLHGNVMIEVPASSAERERQVPRGWSRSTYSDAAGHNAADSRSRLRRVPGGAEGDWAGALLLDEADSWMYGQQRLTPAAPLRLGEEYVLRVAVRAEQAADFSLYIEAWNGPSQAGARGRLRAQASPEWADYEVRMTINDAAAGLEQFRILTQLYTSGVELQFDQARVTCVGAGGPERVLAVRNAGFETSPAPGRLLIPVREGHSVHGGLWEGAYAGGLVYGERVNTEGHGHAMEMDITFVYYSTDGGDSWRRSEGDIIIWRDDGYGGMWPCDEPNVAALRDGRLLLFLRTTLGRIYQCFSTDGGRRWSYPESSPLPSSYSPCCLKRIPENEHTRRAGRAGDLLCVWNNVSFDEVRRGFRRGRLSAAISADDGRTWVHARTLDTAGLPPDDGIAPLVEPQMTRAEKDLGELPLPFGNVHYADITFMGDRVLVKYLKSYTKPNLNMGTRLRILPLDWFYEKP